MHGKTRDWNSIPELGQHCGLHQQQATAKIADNTLNSANAGNWGAGGFELDGRDIILNNNVLTNVPADAVTFKGASCVSFYDKSGGQRSRVQYANRFHPGTLNPAWASIASSMQLVTGGLYFISPLPYGGTPIRSTSQVTVSGAESSNNAAGIAFFADGTVLTDIRIQNSCITNNVSGSFREMTPLFGSTIVIDQPTMTCPATGLNEGRRACHDPALQ